MSCKSIMMMVFSNKYWIRRSRGEIRLIECCRSHFAIYSFASDGNAKNKAVRIILEQYSNFLRSSFLLLRILRTPSSCTRILVPNAFKNPLPSNLCALRPSISNISFNFSYEFDANSPQLYFRSSFPRNAFLSSEVHTYALNSLSDMDCSKISFLYKKKKWLKKILYVNEVVRCSVMIYRICIKTFPEGFQILYMFKFFQKV
ncbi:hypothetical protein C2G38_497441 [Gigaspora rosea]|uniref:Uncharacterized protein n=1 Tax=Gigaspora rosea TaxID=44941 RepID=A0A397U905_9GLOM|nr:hypothetical protein C2G38_497441 [Gigaspora rosea]